jgi:hypothetical protein
MAKTIQVVLEYQDRSSGPGTVGGKTNVEAGGLAAGVGKAVREIFKQMNTFQRRDAAKNGITIKATIVGSGAESSE